MTRFEVKRWKGQLDDPAIIQLIRRKIRGRLMEGSVLVDLDGAEVTADQARLIMEGWTDRDVKFCGSIHSLPAALPADVRLTGRTTPVKPKARAPDWRQPMD